MRYFFSFLIVSVVFFSSCTSDLYRGGIANKSKQKKVKDDLEGYHEKTSNAIVTRNEKNKRKRERKTDKRKSMNQEELNALNKVKKKQKKVVKLPFR